MKLIPKHKFGNKIRKAETGLNTDELVYGPIEGPGITVFGSINNPNWSAALPTEFDYNPRAAAIAYQLPYVVDPTILNNVLSNNANILKSRKKYNEGDFWSGLAYSLMGDPSWFGENETSELVMGIIPDIIPGDNIAKIKDALKKVEVMKEAKLAKEAAKSAKKAKVNKLAAKERAEDKAYRINTKTKTSTKAGKAWANNDMRHVNSGQSRMQNNQIRLALEQMQDATYNTRYSKEYNRLQVKLAKASNPEVIKKINTEIRNLAKNFINEGLLH